LDGRLPGVWVALVLLSTCLSSILLCEQEEDIDNGGASTGPEVVTSSHGTISASRSRTGSGFIEEILGMMVPWLCIMPRPHTNNRSFVLLLETLRLLDIFLPRINFGRAKVMGPSSNLSSLNAGGCRDASMGQSAADAAGFPYLKRDLVRLLGILCHNSKVIQDRIRSCGGIPVVLNLCVIDDRNPCKFLLWPCALACWGRASGGVVTPHSVSFSLTYSHTHTSSP
jgi:ataxin-10